jgi:serine/threonine-protein kinase
MATNPRIGTVVAGYRIESLIGRGGMSVVYLAHHEGLERKAALKLLAPELAENDAFRQRFIRESRIAAGLDHPNVIPVYDAGEADGELFIAMRFVRGSDLRRLLDEHGPLEPADVVRVIDQLGAALDAAHEEGLVHRDVKPANVLLSPATPPARVGHLYLADFGLTKKSLSGSGFTKSGQFVGTIDYVAPEQIRSEPVDGRTDVYSLGCVLYECLTGEPPFVRDTEVAVMFAQLNDPPPNPTAVRPDLPKAIDAVVARAMAKSPDERHGTPGQLATAARDALRTATTVEQEPIAPALPRRSRVRPALIGGAAVALVAATALVVALLGGNQGGPAAGSTTPSGSSAVTTPHSGASSAGAPLLPSGFKGVARVDPKKGALAESFPLHLVSCTCPSQAPRPILAAEGALWLFNGSDSKTTIQKVNPATGAPEDPVPLRDTGVQTVFFAAGQSSVWVLTSAGIRGVGDDALYRVDPGSNDVLASIDIGEQGAGVAAGEEGVWVVTVGGDLQEINTGTNRVRRSVPGIPEATGLALAGGFVWVSDAIQGVVYRVDPDSEKVDTIRLQGADGIAADATGVWVMDRASGTVVRIDPDGGDVGQQIRVGADPASIAVGEGFVWVSDQGDGSVYRVDPGRLESTAIPLGDDPGPGGVSVGEGGVWLTSG